VTNVRERFGGLLPLVVAAFVIGTFLRLVWPDDIHYLGDESWTFEHVQSGAWEPLGMPSSRGLKNAGMSVWVFIVLGKLGGVTTPAGLTRCVAVLALVAHALLLVVPVRFVDDDEDRRAWLWAIILAVTNPILLFLERKIWAQSVLPIFMTGIIIGWMRRDTRGGSFAWGALGAVIGQIHMAGFFFTPALALWTRLFSKNKKTSWLAWLVGSVAGALPAISWLLYLARDRPPATSSPWWLRFRLEFYQYFLSDPFSLSGEYVLGKDLWRAMRWPIVAGHSTWLVLLAHAVLTLTAALFASRALVALWESRRDLRALLRGGSSDTTLLLAAVLAGMGVLMTLPSISIHRHYMLATFPLQYVLVARFALRRPDGDRWLRVLFAGGVFVSFGLLSFVHDVGENAEMGKTYATQLRLGITPEQAKPEGHP
jgi:hypothetical protein